MAAQDWALQTNYHATEILKTETGSKCQQYNNVADHIISAGPLLGKKYAKAK
jgi:hypothetical protein